MPDVLSDAAIAALIAERKVAPADARDRLLKKPASAHLEADLPLEGEARHRFTVKLRQNQVRANDFSVILVYHWEDTGGHVRILRYNGSSHPHRNYLEKPAAGWRFRDVYHIHRATERYQEAGYNADHYAEPSTRYADLKGAFRCLLKDANIVLVEEGQREIFDWWEHA